MCKKTFEWENRFGLLKLSLMTDFVPVGCITGDKIPQQFKFDLDTAQKIALITENKNIQLCVEVPVNGSLYVVVYNGPSTAAIAKIEEIDFDQSVNHSQKINEMDQSTLFLGVHNG